MKIWLLLTALCVAPLALAATPTCSKQSPAHTVALLELYTSEGCSSCPPADRAVSALQQAADADQVVPLAMHIDYWDYIGWKDRFAKPDFTQRQRWLSDLAHSRTVYTPEMFIDGHELRDWQGDLPTFIARINQQPARTSIAIRAGAVSNNALPVEFDIKTPLDAQLFVVLYESGLSSHVGAGENNGVLLRHDYVVRDWLGPIALKADAHGNTMPMTLSRVLPIPSSANPKRLGVAAFVQNSRGDVLQALALPLCEQ